MTSFRIHNQAKGAFATLVVMVSLITLSILGCELLPTEWPLSLILRNGLGCVVLLAGVFCILYVGVCFRFIAACGGPYWVEISDRFTYCNRRGVHVLDWTDIRTVQFEYTNVYQGDDPGEQDGYNTYLRIVLVGNKKLAILVEGTPLPSAAKQAGTIVDTLVQGLDARECHRRRFAAEALGRFGPDGLRHLRKVARTGEHECLRTDATEALRNIERAVPLLQRATKDQDETVRNSATEALRRIQPEPP